MQKNVQQIGIKKIHYSLYSRSVCLSGLNVKLLHFVLDIIIQHERKKANKQIAENKTRNGKTSSQQKQAFLANM